MSKRRKKTKVVTLDQNSCYHLFPTCPFFSVRRYTNLEWTIGKSGEKLLKSDKDCRCLYDDEIVEWHRTCPRCVKE